MRHFVADRSRYVALDCEMVGVGSRGISVLARVSMVDGNGTVILDTYVKVEEPVTDYRTSISGIRPEDLASSNAVSYGECRNKVKQLLRGKIVVGHALQNDLNVLKLSVPWYMIRDTTLYPPFWKSDEFGNPRPRRLKHLTKEFVGVEIQTGEHNSIEDARAAMMLHNAVGQEWHQWIENFITTEHASRCSPRGRMPVAGPYATWYA